MNFGFGFPFLEPASTPAAGNDAVPPTPSDPGETTLEDTAVESGSRADDSAAELADWKARLRYDFERWLSTVEGIPAPADTNPHFEDADPPDLYSFFEQLAILNTESRRANRRTAETLSQWGETLQRFEGELGRMRELATQSLTASGGADRLSRAHCLALVEVLDRLQRLGSAFARTPAIGWFGRDGAWRKAWENQRQAFRIVTDHLEALLQKEGVTRLEALGRLFDPVRMAAVAVEPTTQHPPQTVLEETARGYLWRGELLRAAQVKISVPPNTP